MKWKHAWSLAGLSCLLSSNVAFAHVGFATATATANATIEASFDVGHGCEGLDTYSVKIEIPAGVTSVRVVENQSFASVAAEKDAAGTVTAVVFTRNQSAVRAADDAFYKLLLRFKLPDKPFTTVYFPTMQVCMDQHGTKTATRAWVAREETAADGGMAQDPSPKLVLLPARSTGWNKFTVPAGAETLPVSALFRDAQIVWAGETAFSSNPVTADQIKAEGVAALESIEASAELWVKY